MPRRPGNTMRDFAAGYARNREAATDAAPQLDLIPAAPRPKKPARLKLEVPIPLERETHRSILGHLNKFMMRGGVFHIPNEGLVSLLPPERRNTYINALEADGVLLGNTDLFPVWALPQEWRDALVAAGIDVPAQVALCAGLEVKREHWKPDAEWRKGQQPKAHSWLRARGVPVRICRGVDEAVEFLEDCGVRFRARYFGGARRPGTFDTAQASRRARGHAQSPVAAMGTPGKSPVTPQNSPSRNGALTAHADGAPRKGRGSATVLQAVTSPQPTKKARTHGAART